MGAPYGNCNACKSGRRGRQRISKKGGLIRIPRTHRQLIKAGFKKTRYKNIYIL